MPEIYDQDARDAFADAEPTAQEVAREIARAQKIEELKKCRKWLDRFAQRDDRGYFTNPPATAQELAQKISATAPLAEYSAEAREELARLRGEFFNEIRKHRERVSAVFARIEKLKEAFNENHAQTSAPLVVIIDPDEVAEVVNDIAWARFAQQKATAEKQARRLARR